MPIVPDAKDWTWVLDRPCPECGLDTAAIRPEAVARLCREDAAEWRRVLDRPREVLARRPSEDVWSAVEYACHVRDVFRIMRVRLELMRAEDGARFPNWDQDATAVEERYSEADPAVVVEELVAAASRLADAFDEVAGADWDRTGHRSDGATFTIASFARYVIHDPVHHLHDVRTGLARLEGPGR